MQVFHIILFFLRNTFHHSFQILKTKCW